MSVRPSVPLSVGPVSFLHDENPNFLGWRHFKYPSPPPKACFAPAFKTQFYNNKRRLLRRRDTQLQVDGFFSVINFRIIIFQNINFRKWIFRTDNFQIFRFSKQSIFSVTNFRNKWFSDNQFSKQVQIRYYTFSDTILSHKENQSVTKQIKARCMR